MRLIPLSDAWWEARTMPEPNTGCHLWLGSVCEQGYGRVHVANERSPVLVHRVAYERAYGPISRDIKVCHRCDTPSCVNPDHLFLGTQTDNLRDMFRKGRARPQGMTPGVRATQVLALHAQHPDATQRELGRMLGLSQNRVSQILITERREKEERDRGASGDPRAAANSFA